MTSPTTPPRRLTDEEFACYLHRAEVGNPDASRWASDKIAEHIRAVEQELAEARKLTDDVIKTDYRIESWIKVRDERDTALSRVQVLEKALKLIEYNAPTEQPEFAPDDEFFSGSTSQHYRCALVARKALGLGGDKDGR